MKKAIYIVFFLFVLIYVSCELSPKKAHVPPRVMTHEDSIKGFDSIKKYMQSLSSGEALNYTDMNGARQGHWIIIGAVERQPGYTDRDKVEEGNYYYGKKQGLWIEYWPGGAIKDSVVYK